MKADRYEATGKSAKYDDLILSRWHRFVSPERCGGPIGNT